MQNKKGILAVSFGTSHQDTRARTIDAIESTFRETFPDYTVYRAWTSGMIRRKLLQTTGEEIPDVAGALAQMEQDGITHVYVQPTHIIDGIENQQMQTDAEAFRSHFQHLAFGEPLLSSPKDLERTAAILAGHFSDLADDEALILMGHGSAHPANQVYSQLDSVLKQQGHKRIHIGTVEAFPDLTHVLEQLRDQPVRRVRLAPFMIVAGDHAVNDMAGDGEDSWKNRCLEAGYEVACCLEGLGEYPEFREMFVEHLKGTGDF